MENQTMTNERPVNKCKACESTNVVFNIVSEVSEKKHGLVWKLFVGWWWIPLKWFCFFGWALVLKLFGKTKIKQETVTYKVCQDCGFKERMDYKENKINKAANKREKEEKKAAKAELKEQKRLAKESVNNEEKDI